MKRKLPASAIATIAALFLATISAFAAEDNFNWNGTLSNGQTLTVMDINGSIDVKPSSGNAVSVAAVKTTRRGTPDDVEIKVEQEPSGVVVCTLYRREDGSFPSGCRDRSKGRTKRNVDVKVEYTILMPSGANLDANTVNGNVNIAGMMADVEASTVNGSVNVETTGHAQAKTVNGTVNAKVGKLDQDTSFSTVNGKIVVAIGSALNADVTMSTVNGGIETDFPITIQGQMSKRSLKGRIGNGGPVLKLSTVNGGIRLEKAS